ncbi:dTMP kinase [Alteromonas facilis]|uniref:dTMP kinase n=1 Tax=Alteromonas facilis TaxID=2048004 RepID=UPI000C28B7A7|nr:dTMP kinase [Alteromonas facilis]
MKSGKFIVVEGLEGAGKSSVIATIVEFLKQHGHSVTQTREPGGTPMAEALRDCVKQQWQEAVTIETELMLMYAARSQLIANVITPALDSGDWVVGDRHDMSSLAYQGGGRGIDRKLLDVIRDVTLKGFTPDLTLYLDVDPKVGLERARGRGELDRIELEGLDFFERVRTAYQQEALNNERVVTINAMQSMSDVHEQVTQSLQQYFSS